MKLVTYNIQYSKGKDATFDLERIVDAVRGADIIGLQEVTRNMPGVPDADQPARIAALLPEYYWSYASPIDMDLGSGVENGRAMSKRLEFGNMVLSRWPISSKRALLLPRTGNVDNFDMQNGVLEAFIAAPGGAIRIYVTHLNYLRSQTRHNQLDWLVPKLFAITCEGGGITGRHWQGIPVPPTPKSFIVLGDFNLTPNCDEYDRIVGKSDYYHGRVATNDHWIDSWTRSGNDEQDSITWYDEADDFKSGLRLDFGFVSPDLADKIRTVRIDRTCAASDHQPYWLEMDL
ncbi:MAG: endonuclease/exonuclease/phosphatase family protein [Rhodobacteraceae bacterium]|nr:endonuclease/exonuclease/phosphatase family protein [Paracoccaceae bacterium]